MDRNKERMAKKKNAWWKKDTRGENILRMAKAKERLAKGKKAWWKN